MSYRQPSSPRRAGKEAVSRAELDGLRAQRRKPVPLLELTPGGSQVQQAHQLEEVRRASHAGYIEHRLNRQEGRATSDFAFARMQGKVGHDFERSR